mmetsp:Transcript_42803/g.67085  ORF Transcript_42803/g.67085 Transcript_42803/m.67085 type:complete len:316 (+) Transcript_42803:188-1135(+)
MASVNSNEADLSQLVSKLKFSAEPAGIEKAPGGVALNKINDELYFAGQISPATVNELKSTGIKTVFNLRFEEEEGYVDLSKECGDVGIQYLHYPLDWGESWTDAVLDKLMATIDSSKAPHLFYCEIGARAATVACTYSNTRSRFNDGMMLAELPDSTRMGTILFELLGSEERTQELEKAVGEYMNKKVKNMLSRPGMKQLADDVYVAGQLSEKEFEDAAKQGVRGILNMRPVTEAGEFGMGVLAREEEIVKNLGLKYVNIPVPKSGPYANELLEQINQSLAELPRPVLVHCRTGRRASNAMDQAEKLKAGASVGN